MAEKRTLAQLCRKMIESARRLRRTHGVVPSLPDPVEFLSKNGHQED
jgi:hypothetical protein